MKTILIVDDEPKITRILDLQLRHSGYRTFVANNGEEAVALALGHNIDLVLMDIMMPVMDGIEAMKRIKAHNPKVPVILLTAKDDTSDIVEGLDSGGDEYVTKPFVFEELDARIRARLRSVHSNMNGGEGGEGGEKEMVAIEYREIKMDPLRFECYVGGNLTNLSKTEFDLLFYLLRHKGKVISREELLKNVWGYHYGGSNIVDVYINYLREKISRNMSTRIIETVRGRGYIIQ